MIHRPLGADTEVLIGNSLQENVLIGSELYDILEITWALYAVDVGLLNPDA